MEAKKITLGFAPTHRGIFGVEDALAWRKKVKEIVSGYRVNLVDMDEAGQTFLMTQEDVVTVTQTFRAAGVDALFFPYCSFGEEGMVAQVAKALNVPVLIYGPRDEAPDATGMRYRDAQCGMFAVGKVLRRFGVPFTYLTSTDPDSAYFRTGFDKFLKVASVVKAMRNIRVLQIGPRPDPFLSVMVNESELLEKFSVQVFPIAVSDIALEMKRIQQENGQAYRDTLSYIQNTFTGTGMSREDVGKYAALKLAILSKAKQFRCNCAAIQCWNALQDLVGIWACATNALLASEGFPVACETDIHGAISALLLQAATGHTLPHFFSDVTIRHPQNDNAELLWHCGCSPVDFAAPGEECKIRNSWLGGSIYGNCDFKMQDGNLTVCRFDGDNGQYSLFIGEGKSVDGPRTKGTYVWCEVADWPLWEHKLVQGPYIHHVAGTYDQVADVLYEACRYIPHLQADPATPTEEEIQRRWRE